MAKKTKKKTVMESLFIDEISGVDQPAQEGAKALLIKRDEEDYWKRDFSAEQRSQLAEEGQALPDGSFPIVNVADLRNAISAFGRAKNKGLAAKHIKRRAGALGATELLPEEGLLALKSVSNGKVQKEQKTMTDKNEKTVEAVEKQLQEIQGELAVSKAFGALNDAEKAHYADLDSKEQTAFLKMDADGRKAVLSKIQEADPVVYTDSEGNDYRKSDDPRTVSSAKRADKAEKIAKEERDKREDQELEKRAGAELDNLPGDLDVKKALLKAVNGIKDEKIREGVDALIKAGNSGLKDAFKRRGAQGEGEDLGLNDEYEKLAQEYAKENEVSIEIARADVLTATQKGRELAKRMEDERRK